MIHSFTVCASGPPCGETRAAWRDRFFGGTNNQAGIRRPSNVRYLTSFPSANSPVGSLPRRLSTRTRPLLPEAATRRSGVVNVEQRKNRPRPFGCQSAWLAVPLGRELPPGLLPAVEPL